jgi:ubiquinone biosynthesis protein COQ9
MSKQHLDDIRQAILEAAMPHVPFDGWTRDTMRRAVKEAGIEAAMADLAFPRGPVTLLDLFASEMDARMLEALEAKDLGSMRIRDRIICAVRTRLECLEPYREAERRAVGFLALPPNAPLGLRLMGRTVDAMWRAAGDRSTDFSYYTKRALLAGVYSTTLAHWLQDESDDYEETWAFLARRVEDVMKIQKMRGRLDTYVEKLPSPLGVLRGFKDRGAASMRTR